MSFVDIRTYCNNYLNAQIKNLGGTSAGSIIYNPDYVFTDKVKGIQQDNPITNVDAPLDYTTPYYPIENGQNVPVDRTIKISDLRLTALVLTSKTSFSTGASVEQQLQLNLDISGKLSGGVGAGVGYSLKIQTTAKTELSQEKSETTTIKTGVPDQDFVKTLPPNYKGKYAIQFYKTEPLFVPNGWTVVIIGDISRYGYNAYLKQTKTHSHVIAYKTFKWKGENNSPNYDS